MAALQQKAFSNSFRFCVCSSRSKIPLPPQKMCYAVTLHLHSTMQNTIWGGMKVFKISGNLWTNVHSLFVTRAGMKMYSLWKLSWKCFKFRRPFAVILSFMTFWWQKMSRSRKNPEFLGQMHHSSYYNWTPPIQTVTVFVFVALSRQFWILQANIPRLERSWILE